MDRRAGETDHVPKEQHAEQDRVLERDASLGDDDERIQRRDDQNADVERDPARQRQFGLGAVVGATAQISPGVTRSGFDQLARARRLPGEEEDHGRPAHAEQQAVGAGHIRQRQVGLLREPRERHRVRRVLPRLVGQEQVDRVLGQHGDERHQGDRQRRRDVVLRRLGAGGDQERRRQDRQTGDRHLRVRIEFNPTQPKDQRRNPRQHSQDQQSPGSSEIHMDSVSGNRTTVALLSSRGHP